MASAQEIDADPALTADIPAGDSLCAPVSSMANVTPADCQKLLRLVQYAKDQGLISGKRSIDSAKATVAKCEAMPGKPSSSRDDQHDETANNFMPITESADRRTTSTSHVNMLGSESTSTEPSWPDETELFELGVAMLTGGHGSPAAPAKRYAVARATHALLVRVEAVAKKLKKERGSEMHPVPGTAGRIDQQESRGYLLGAVLGRSLVTREQAQAAGLDARNKLNALEKRLASAKEAARYNARVARKAGGDAPEKQAAAAASALSAIKCERFEIDGLTAAQPAMPPLLPQRKRQRAHAHPRWFLMPSWDEVNAAMDQADAEHVRLAAAVEAAQIAFDSARATLRKAEAALDALEPGGEKHITFADYMRMKPSNQARVEERENRAWAKYHAAHEADWAAVHAHHAACDAADAALQIWQRMAAWVTRDDRVTPFPWPGDEFIDPCSAIDLDYYEARPDRCPPEVREWYYRYQEYLTPECEHHPVDSCPFCEAAFELGTMRSVEKVWYLRD